MSDDSYLLKLRTSLNTRATNVLNRLTRGVRRNEYHKLCGELGAIRETLNEVQAMIRQENGPEEEDDGSAGTAKD